MASGMKPVKLWGHPMGPNPFKVLIVLCALGIPYTIEPLTFQQVKQEPYISLNPNGRMPALEDPNNDDLVLWESGAIIQYLVEQYDKDGKISYSEPAAKKYAQLQWSMFQMSGQGPYFGQLAWFGKFHPEKIESAIERYKKEQDRIFSVIDLHLSRTKTDFLVGDKCTYADLMFVPWHRTGMDMPGDHFIDNVLPEKYPLANAWKVKLFEQEGVKKALAAAKDVPMSH